MSLLKYAYVDAARGRAASQSLHASKLVVAVRAAMLFHAVESDVDERANRDAIGRRPFMSCRHSVTW